MNQPLIILDADGVFLNERPYWNAALKTSLVLNDLNVSTDCDWRTLTDEAFENVRIQRITKRRGCNSNWDLAAVLTAAIRVDDTWERINKCLSARDWKSASHCLVRASRTLWNDDCPITKDPLCGFGLDRRTTEFKAVQDQFQVTLTADGHGQHTFELCAGMQDIRCAFHEMLDLGYQLTVCTGRPRSELFTALQVCSLGGFFRLDKLVTADDVMSSEHVLNTRPLGKPHWFSVVYAALGGSFAESTVATGHVPHTPQHRVIYVGDALPDFWCTIGARAVGLDLEYVHVRSGVTDEEQEASIADTPYTLAIVDSVCELPRFLNSPSMRSA